MIKETVTGTCDFCPAKIEMDGNRYTFEWPKGWVRIALLDQRTFHICPECWPKIELRHTPLGLDMYDNIQDPDPSKSLPLSTPPTPYSPSRPSENFGNTTIAPTNMTTEQQVQLLTLSGDATSLAEEISNSATETQFLLTRGDP